MKALSESSNRIGWVDIAKGIGIFFVVFAHVDSSISDQIYLFHMPLFFFLSGMFFNNKRNFVPFIVNKIRYLLIPLFVFMLISIPVRYAYFTYINYNFSFGELLKPSVSNVPLWFLPVLFLLNVILFFEKYKLIKYFLVLLLIYGIFSFGNSFFKFQIFSKVLYCLAFFSLGKLFWKNKDWLFTNKFILFFVSLFIFSFGIYLTYSISFRLDLAANKADGGGFSHFIVAVGGIGFILSLSIFFDNIKYKTFSYPVKTLKLIGFNSLYVFGLHWIFIQPIILIDSHLGIQSNGLFLSVFLISISIGIGILLKKLLPLFFR